jgi:toxin CcdB
VARFDVYQQSERVPFLLDIQANLFADLNTRTVIPLMPQAGGGKSEALLRLKPILTVKGQTYVMVTTDITTVRVAILGKFIENLEDQRQTIIDAVDFLLQGF